MSTHFKLLALVALSCMVIATTATEKAAEKVASGTAPDDRPVDLIHVAHAAVLTRSARQHNDLCCGFCVKGTVPGCGDFTESCTCGVDGGISCCLPHKAQLDIARNYLPMGGCDYIRCGVRIWQCETRCKGNWNSQTCADCMGDLYDKCSDCVGVMPSKAASNPLTSGEKFGGAEGATGNSMCSNCQACSTTNCRCDKCASGCGSCN